MPIVKIDIHKLSAEKNLSARGGQIRIDNTVSLKNVEVMDFSLEGKKGLKFSFSFTCTYQPDLGTIIVEGKVLFVDELKKVDDIKKGWDKDKKIPPAIMEMIANAALHKGNIQAIKVSEEVNLPSPLPLPKVKSAAIAR